MITVKVYSPSPATEESYCDKCHNLIAVGEVCTTVTHPVEEGKQWNWVEAICAECLFEEAE